MYERPLQLSVFDEQLVAATRRVGPRPRAMKDDRAFLYVRRLQPQGHAERLVAPEIPKRQIDCVVAREFHRLAMHARHEPVVPLQRRVRFFVERVRELVILQVVEIEAADFSRQRDFARARLQPFGKRRVLPRSQCRRLLLLVCDGAPQRCQLFLRRGVEQRHRGGRHALREIRIQPGLVDIAEHREETVVIALGDGIELVVVAPRALERQPQERGRHRLHPVRDVLHISNCFKSAA